jgi:hypothetical protein
MGEPRYPAWFMRLPFPARVLLNAVWALVTLPVRLFRIRSRERAVRRLRDAALLSLAVANGYHLLVAVIRYLTADRRRRQVNVEGMLSRSAT